MDNMLHVAMQYFDLKTGSLNALSSAMKARSRGDLELARKWDLSYNEMCKELTELSRELSKLPVPDRIAGMQPVVVMTHDQIAAMMGGRVPGCGCDKCQLNGGYGHDEHA